MARDQPTVRSPNAGIGKTPRVEVRSLDELHTEVTKIKVDDEYTKRFLTELQSDMRDVRDRMARLEVKVDHLPSKGFIVVVVTTFLVIAGGLITIAPKLWNWSGAIVVATPPSR